MTNAHTHALHAIRVFADARGDSAHNARLFAQAVDQVHAFSATLVHHIPVMPNSGEALYWSVVQDMHARTIQLPDGDALRHQAFTIGQVAAALMRSGSGTLIEAVLPKLRPFVVQGLPFGEHLLHWNAMPCPQAGALLAAGLGEGHLSIEEVFATFFCTWSDRNLTPGTLQPAIVSLAMHLNAQPLTLLEDNQGAKLARMRIQSVRFFANEPRHHNLTTIDGVIARLVSPSAWLRGCAHHDHSPQALGVVHSLAGPSLTIAALRQASGDRNSPFDSMASSHHDALSLLRHFPTQASLQGKTPLQQRNAILKTLRNLP